MDSRTRFFIILVALLTLFLALFFLSGVLYVRKNHRVVIAKRGHYFRSVSAGWYYFLPWLYQIQNPLATEKAIYRFRNARYEIEWQGVVADARLYFERDNSYRKTLRNVLQKNLSKEDLSLQILSQLKQNGWDVERVGVTER